MRDIALIGMMASGKTTVGRLLAQKLHKKFIDIDAEIEQKNMTISEIFEKYGEHAFRDIEQAEIAAAAELRGTVISCGGGAVIRNQNMITLKNCGYCIVLLRVRAETVLGRATTASRPLLKKPTIESIEKIMSERADDYIKFSDFIVEADELTAEHIVENIIEWIKEEK